MLEFLFPGATQVKELQAKLKKADEAKEAAEKAVKLERRLHDDEIYEIRRSAERRVKNAEDKNVDLERQVKNLNTELAETREITDETIQKRVLEATYNAEIEAMLKVEKEVDTLKADVARETAQSGAAQAEVKILNKTVDGLRSDIKAYQEFVQFVLTMLPKVDMSKFNINVEVPKTEVTVATTESKK